MTVKERIKNWKLHPSQRGWFSFELYKAMARDDSIWLVVGDLGWGVFDAHFQDYPDRCINTGAAETAMIGIGVGLAMEGKIPVVYSITPFLIWRPAETIRLYLGHEGWPVKLAGSGRDDDYKHDGFSHNAKDAKKFLKQFSSICQEWPETKEWVANSMESFLYCPCPHFVSLKR